MTAVWYIAAAVTVALAYRLGFIRGRRRTRQEQSAFNTTFEREIGNMIAARGDRV